MRMVSRRKSNQKLGQKLGSGVTRRLGVEGLEVRSVMNADGALAVCLSPDLTVPSAVLDQPHVVFAPDTPAEIMAAYDDLENHEGFDAFSLGDTDRWTRTVTNGSGLVQGDATTIRWSVVPDGTPISGYNGEAPAPSNLRSWLAGIYGSNSSSTLAQDQPWFSPLRQVFDRWSDVSGITYVYEPADDAAAISSSYAGVVGVRGDVRISGHYIDGPSNILAYNFYPTFGDMVLDTGDTFFANTGSNSLRLRNTVAHEAGHGLGLGHVSPTNGTKLMEPSISLGFDGPQADDILAVNRGYGDRLEKNGGNNTAATAAPLGTTGSFTVDTISIDDDSDVDWFQVTVGAGSSLSVNVTPTGSTYTSNGTAFNSLAQSNLALAIYGSGGDTLIASATANGAGVAETLSNVALPGSGTYYVRVTGSANAAQMYRLTGSVTNVTAGAPEIVVQDSASEVADNTGTVSFGTITVGASATKTFTIRNSGSADLVLGSNVSLPTGFTLSQPISTTTLAPGASTSFGIAVNSSVAGSLGGSVSFTTNDADENPFNFSIAATVTAPTTQTPEIAVLEGTTNIADNTGTVSFGSVAVGTAATKSFAIQNQGTSSLTLGAVTVPTGFTLVNAPASTVAPGGSTTFTVSMNTAVAGSYSGAISIPNNDADENPFNFAISVTITATQPTTVFSDNFNRTNSTSLGTSWTERAGNMSISSGTLVNSVSGTSVALVNGVTLADVVLTADVNVGSGFSSRDSGLVARHNSSGAGSQYWAGLSYSSGRYYAQIWESAGGVWTRLSSTQVSSGSGSLRFEVVGQSLKLSVNGRLTNSVTDSSLTSGSVGVSATNTGTRVDNLVITRPVSAAASATTAQPQPTFDARWAAVMDQIFANWSTKKNRNG